MSGSSEGRNTLLTKEVTGKWPDWFELTGRLLAAQITTLYYCGELKEQITPQTLTWISLTAENMNLKLS